jgi:multicomponent Na+:H+ antiporter subunit A
MMALLLAAHAVVGGGIVLAGERLGRRALWPAAVPLGATFLWLLWRWPSVLDGATVEESMQWVPQLDMSLQLRLDGFGALMVLLVSGVGLLVLAYSASYFPRVQVGLGRLIGLLVLFAGAMLGLVLADNLLVVYGFWELTSIASYFLIGNRSSSARARAAALQALLITGAGALAMLVGFILIGQAAGTYQLSAILADPPSGSTIGAALALVLIGAATKSAQYPFHSWLPGAMVAPTPVSAYLHSATMVKAGVYLIARFTPAFAGVAWWRPVVVTIGLVSMVAGGLRALRQHDLKLVLAFGTVSQLGFLVVLFGWGTDYSIAAGCVLLLAHAAFKAALFMSVGVVDHQLGTRDVRELPALGRRWPALAATVGVAAASMAGVPLTLGFISKEKAYEALLQGDGVAAALAVAGVVGASVLTFGYSAWILFGVAAGGGRADVAAPDESVRPAVRFLAPGLLLAAFTLVAGVLPWLLDGIVTGASSALEPSAPAVHLAIWHGVNAALGLSVLTIAAGVVVFLQRGAVERALSIGRHVPSGNEVYLLLLRGVNRLADRVTGIVQNGSLPVYAGVILVTTMLVPGIALLSSVSGETFEVSDARRSTVIASVVIVAILLAAAVTAAGIRRRYAAALLLAGVGYSMAGLFVVQGAPDLALTTVAVESLFTILFVLVLRSLPDQFEQRVTRGGRLFRGVVAAVVGSVVFVFALVASGERLPSNTSAEMIDRALPDGNGRNVVNVILVDFRGLDTLGELTVLAAASIGAVALARAVRRPGRPPEQQPTETPEPVAPVPDGGDR